MLIPLSPSKKISILKKKSYFQSYCLIWNDISKDTIFSTNIEYYSQKERYHAQQGNTQILWPWIPMASKFIISYSQFEPFHTDHTERVVGESETTVSWEVETFPTY